MVRNLRHGGYGVFPLGGIVGLKGIIETVIAHPKGHQIATEDTQLINAALGQIDRRLSHGFIGMGECAQFETGFGVIAHGKAIQLYAIVCKAVFYICLFQSLQMIWIIQINRVQAFHLGCARNQIKRRRLLSTPIAISE